MIDHFFHNVHPSLLKCVKLIHAESPEFDPQEGRASGANGSTDKVTAPRAHGEGGRDGERRVERQGEQRTKTNVFNFKVLRETWFPQRIGKERTSHGRKDCNWSIWIPVCAPSTLCPLPTAPSPSSPLFEARSLLFCSPVGFSCSLVTRVSFRVCPGP